MKILSIGVGIWLAAAWPVYGQSENGNSLERAFQEGGEVHLKLASGNYIVREGRADRILIHWTVKNPEDAAKVKVHADVTNAQATIRTEGRLKEARVVIEIPARSDLRLRVRAGDIQISGIEGNKDVKVTAGDLNIVARAESYSQIKASVTFGDLKATSLGISKGGIKRSLEWQGAGLYKLKASLFAGDLELTETPLEWVASTPWP